MKHIISQQYHKLIADKKIEANQAQKAIVTYLDKLHTKLTKRFHQRNSLFGKIRRKLKVRKTIKGLYLWGHIGTGKTMLLDLLYDNLDVPKKRQHFFEFMQEVHQQLKQHQGQKNPLKAIGRTLAEHYHVIFFDEFMVKNIADAMLLAELFDTFFQRGMCLITTSNIAPDDLYEEGLQRERFLPAISLLNKQTRVIHIQTEHDYRGSFIQHQGTYYTPLNPATQNAMAQAFSYFAQDATATDTPLTIQKREMPVIQRTDSVVWLDFKTLCQTARCSEDYLELAQTFKTILISHIPVIAAEDRKTITRFIHLIDILYDHQVSTVLSAATQPPEIYSEGPHHAEFQRTLSRIFEMRSAEYHRDIP